MQKKDRNKEDLFFFLEDANVSNDERLEKARLIQEASNAYVSYLNEVLAASKRIEHSRSEGLNRFFNKWDPKNKTAKNMPNNDTNNNQDNNE